MIDKMLRSKNSLVHTSENVMTSHFPGKKDKRRFIFHPSINLTACPLSGRGSTGAYPVPSLAVHPGQLASLSQGQVYFAFL